MVHEIILQQLGGNKFLAMTGSKNLMYSSKEDNFLSMRLTRNKIGAQFLKITLKGDDTYTMTFSKSQKVMDRTIGIKVDQIVILKEIDGVYCDMLQDVFTEYTGLYTHL